MHPSDTIPTQSGTRLGELEHGAPLTSDGPDEPATWWWDRGHAASHNDYQRLREEHARRLDEDHRQWRRERFRREFEDWRRGRRPLEPAQALGPRGGGLAFADAPLSARAGGEADLASDNGQTLFERS